MATSVQSIRGTNTLSSKTQEKITNLVIATPATEVSHTLVSGLKEAIIRSRDIGVLQISFTATESGTKYFSIPKGNTLFLDDLNFSGKTLYIQSTVATTVEILELS